MAVSVEDKITNLSTAKRKKVEARGAELIDEEMTLRGIRRTRKLTQVRLTRSERSTVVYAEGGARDEGLKPVAGRRAGRRDG